MKTALPLQNGNGRSRFHRLNNHALTGEEINITLTQKKSNREPTGINYKSRYSAIGLDLGSDRVKLLQMQYEKNKVSISEKCIFPTPPGAIVNSKIKDARALCSELKQVKSNLNWHGSRAFLALNSRACFMRQVTMPVMSKKELDRAMRLEAEKHFSLDPTRTLTGYCNIYPNPEDNEKSAYNFLLASVDKEISDAYGWLALEAGFTPRAIETAPLALIRSLSHGTGKRFAEKRKMRLLLDCGNQSTTLTLAVANNYRAHRSLNLGLEHFKKTIKPRKNLSGKTLSGEELLHDKRSLEEKGLLELAGKLSKGINESLDYWIEKGELQESNLPPLEVCGGGIFIPGLPSYLKTSLKQDLILYNPLKGLKGEPAAHEGALFQLAHGLALRGWQ